MNPSDPTDGPRVVATLSELANRYGGLNPSTVTGADLRSLVLRSHTPGDIEDRVRARIIQGNSTVLSAVRAKCHDCCVWQPTEVTRCVAVTCPLWPFRMGKNPFREKRTMSEEEKAERRERLAKAKAASEGRAAS